MESSINNIPVRYHGQEGALVVSQQKLEFHRKDDDGLVVTGSWAWKKLRLVLTDTIGGQEALRITQAKDHKTDLLFFFENTDQLLWAEDEFQSCIDRARRARTTSSSSTSKSAAKNDKQSRSAALVQAQKSSPCSTIQTTSSTVSSPATATATPTPTPLQFPVQAEALPKSLESYFQKWSSSGAITNAVPVIQPRLSSSTPTESRSIQMEARILQLEKQVAELRQENNDLRGHALESTTRIVRLEKTVDDLVRENRELQQRRPGLENTVHQLIDKLQENSHLQQRLSGPAIEALVHHLIDQRLLVPRNYYGMDRASSIDESVLSASVSSSSVSGCSSASVTHANPTPIADATIIGNEDGQEAIPPPPSSTVTVASTPNKQRWPAPVRVGSKEDVDNRHPQTNRPSDGQECVEDSEQVGLATAAATTTTWDSTTRPGVVSAITERYALGLTAHNILQTHTR